MDRRCWRVSLQEFMETWRKRPLVEVQEEATEPKLEIVKLYEEHYGIYRSLYRATAEAMHRL
jgi:hypothetical protein